MEAVFWVSVLGVVHPWVLYPLCVALIGWHRGLVRSVLSVAGTIGGAIVASAFASCFAM